MWCQLIALIYSGLSLYHELSCSNMLVLAVYAAAGVAGAYASAFLGPRHTYTVGASGAIWGLRMATLALPQPLRHRARADAFVPRRGQHGVPRALLA